VTGMEYDFEDPNFDFAGNAEIIAAKLRKAREMQNMEAPKGVSAPGVFAMSQPDIGGAIQRGVGRYEQAQAEQARGSMNTEQLRRYDELSRGLNEMKPIDYSNPDEALMENSRRQALAGQMSKLNLPMAQKTAQTYLDKGAAFPETIAQLKMKQIEAGEQAALRAQEKSRSDSERNQLLMAIAGNRQDIAQAGLDLKREGVEEKQDTSRQKALDAESGYIKGAQHLEGLISELQGTPNLNAATGAVGGRTPFFFSLTPNDKSTAQSRIKNLQEFLQTKGLEDLRRAGVAPGSVTEKEWAKFAARAGNIDPNLSDEAFNKEVAKLLVDVQGSLVSAQSRMDALPKPGVRGQQSGAPAGSPGAAPTGAGKGNMVHDPVSNKTYVKDANGRWWMQ